MEESSMRRSFTVKRLMVALYISILLLDRPAQANPEKAACSKAVDVGSPGFKNHGMVEILLIPAMLAQV